MADVEDKHEVFIVMVCKMYNAEDKTICLHCDGGARPYLSKSCLATELCFSLDII